MDNTPWLKNNGNANVVPEIRFPTAYETETTTQHRTYEHPVSCGQRALWYFQELSPNSAAYNIVIPGRILKKLDIPAFQRACQKMVDRHPALRTTFAERNGIPVQIIHEQMEVFLQLEDVPDLHFDQIQHRLIQELFRPFDLKKGPLLRLTVLNPSGPEHILIVAMHHIVSDYWSMALFISELGAVYTSETTGIPANLKPIRAQLTDQIHWQENMLAGPDGEQLRKFWQQQLAGELPLLNLPTDRPRPPIQSHFGAGLTVRMNAELVQKLDLLARSHGATLFMVLLAAFKVLLFRYTGQEDLVVGSPGAGRDRKTARTIGYFVNPLVLRTRLDGNPTVTEVISRVRRTVLAAFDHSEYPFHLLVEQFQPKRDLSRPPLVPVVFAWQKTTRLIGSQDITPFAMNEAGGKMALGELVIESLELQQRVAPFEVMVWLAEAGADLLLMLEYNTDLFDASTIHRLLGHYLTVLDGMVTDPGQRIANLPLLTKDEQKQLLVEWNASSVVYAELPSQCVHHVFEEQVNRTPDAVAVVCNQKQLSYGELNRQANQLARYLKKLGVGPDVAVGLYCNRTIEMMAALLAIVKTGGIYVPLDGSYPTERLAFILKDANISVLITQQMLSEKLPKHQARCIYLDRDWQQIARESSENANFKVTPGNNAYIIYTSGSTGMPKGVEITHGELAWHCHGMKEYYQLNNTDRVLQFAALNFDASLEQILPTLIAGASLVLRDDIWTTSEFIQKIVEFGLTVINLPTAYWCQLVQEWVNLPAALPASSLRLVIIGGDKMTTTALCQWQQLNMKTTRLLNAYGPTETTITATAFEIPVDFTTASGSIPIGRPLKGRKAYILDSWGNPVPVGIPGELLLGGFGLARGYHNRPDLTKTSFITDPFSDLARARLYKTGDLVRYLPDGNIEFLGRVDDQVKIRGFRIEPGEISGILDSHPAIKESIVIPREDIQGEKRLVAYVELDSKVDRKFEPGEFRSFLMKKLPEYMIPSAFVPLEALPKTPGGKIDRRALPVPDQTRASLKNEYVAPRTPAEESIANLWATVLGIERVGIYDNFFELGGHSLLATQIISKLHESFEVELPLRDFFDAPTIADLSMTLTQKLAEQQKDVEMEVVLAELEGLSEDDVTKLLNE